MMRAKLPRISKVQIIKDLVKESKSSVNAVWKGLDQYCFNIRSLGGAPAVAASHSSNNAANASSPWPITCRKNVWPMEMRR